MAGRTDHICSGRTCMFCRVLENPQKVKGGAGTRAYMDNQVIERVKELEERSLLTTTAAALSNSGGEDIERLALIDSLTDLYNSRTFLKEIKDELKRAKRYKRPVSLIIAGVDNFDEMQRSFGALTADSVLKLVGSVIKSAVRDVDIAARYSAGEFAIILPETNAQGAAIVAERIRSRVANHDITHNWHNLKVSTSVGVAAFPSHAREHDELIHRTIQALEAAFQKGGNQVVTSV
ncbi:MAG: GGDEF domain-containing protein [Candidatus Obscuribacterales bacterium]|nr:GGDEF domain-containing protein [Candidatus Obscuribacterales bacterium]